jgi:hypothetical protein
MTGSGPQVTSERSLYCLPHRLSTMVNQIALLINRCLSAILAGKRLPAIREHWFLRHKKIHQSIFNL